MAKKDKKDSKKTDKASKGASEAIDAVRSAVAGAAAAAGADSLRGPAKELAGELAAAAGPARLRPARHGRQARDRRPRHGDEDGDREAGPRPHGRRSLRRRQDRHE